MENSKEVKTPKLRLFADRVLVRVIKDDEHKTASGIIMVPRGEESKVCKRGEVLRMSAKIHEHMDKEDKIELGEVVMFSQHAGSDINYDIDEYKILRITDIFCVDEEAK